MSSRLHSQRGLSLLVVFSLLLAGAPAPALAQDQGDELGQGENQRGSTYLPLVGNGATDAPPAVPPAIPPTPPADSPAPVPYGDDGKWPVQLAGSTGAVQPNLHGPQRNIPEDGIPTHAYSPFDERNNREHPCPPNGCNVMPGQLLVKLAPGVPTQRAGGALRTADAALNATLDELGLVTLAPVFPTARAPRAGELIATVDGDPMPKPDLTRWVLATFANPDADLTAAVTTLRTAERITWVEPVYLRKPVGEMRNAERGMQSAQSETRPSGRAARTTQHAAPTTQHAAALTFDDPLYAQQWHLGATNVPQAWEWLASQGLPPGGNRDIVVAVIDTGVDYTHPDLAANIWTNPQEIAGNGVDDDGNGYVDDIHGADTVTPDGDPQDDHGHGTHVAGVIAAQANNGIGGVGVAYNVQVMPLKAAQYSGVLASSDIAEAIYYAVEKGADVINMSFGGYARSQIEEDALAVAFGQAVLVAAAGNDGRVNLPCIGGRDMYPAAYNWVLGVMASQQLPDLQSNFLARFSNYDCIAQDSHEYELMAPGVDVWSTLPDEQYAAWDGTSMAAPVVAGIAALARTRWNDKEVYSSRFIMGQIAANTAPDIGAVADAYAAITVAPKPRLAYLEHWLFDTTAQAASNDNDGIVDAGETVDLAIVIRNHWGKAEPVTVTLEAWAAGAFQADPYVTMLTNTVDYGAIGSFNMDDNGLLYDSQGAITGVLHPFRFVISPNTPNDHVISFRLTSSAANGYDPNDPGAPFTFVSRFYLIVQRGVELRGIISQDMTLIKDYYYLLPAATLIEAGVNVTVSQGTQLQFWSGDPNDPYNSGANAFLQVEGNFVTQGTQAEPVELFPSSIFPHNAVRITRPGPSAHVRFSYTRIRNANIEGSDGAEHCYFDQSNYNFLPRLDTDLAANSIFHRLGPWRGYFVVGTNITGNLYDSCSMRLNAEIGTNNVFLKNYKREDSQYGRYSVSYENGSGYWAYPPQFLRTALPTEYNGNIYVALQRISGSTRYNYLEAAAEFASRLGGHVVRIDDAAENDFVRTYRGLVNETAFNAAYPAANCCTSSSPCGCWSLFQGSFAIGLTDQDSEGDFVWVSGEPVSFTNWSLGEPNNHDGGVTNQDFVQMDNLGQWADTEDIGGPIVLELPGTLGQITQVEAALSSAREQAIADGNFNTFRDNAFLNVWRDPDIGHWMRFVNPLSRDRVLYLTHNWWGTTSTTLVAAAIEDYADNFNLGSYDFTPMLNEPPANAYPFVANVIVSTAHDASATQVAAEPITLTVTFNRAMDFTIQPKVSFGPDVPFTDYTTHPVAGGWQDPRTWQGTFGVTPVTGDGYQFIRVADAVAADDPWLITGDDSERFQFEIITSGTEAMNLQANGGEGFVDLSWTQDDFDLLSGFNIYRATSENGTYTRANNGIIPPQQRAFRDTNVTPGVPYFYKFTVVKSDMSESDYSNTATAAPVDTIAPVVTHTPATTASPGLPLTLVADVTDNVAVQTVTLFFRSAGSTNYTTRAMTRTTGNRFTATIEGTHLVSPGLEYYIEAGDGVSTARAGRADLPFVVTVVDRPVVTTVAPNQGAAAGGTTVTVRGSNFKAGAAVAFGGVPAAGVTVLSSSEITCTTGAHFPELVDVRVTNPDGQFGQLLRGYTYVADTASVGLPDVSGGQQELVTIPINAANVAGLAAAELTLTFDPAVLHATGVRTGSLTPGWSLTANTSNAGQVRLALISPGATAAGAGVLANVEFQVLAAAGVTTTLHLADLLLNDGAIPVQSADGSFTVAQVYAVSGAVQTWKNGAAVPNVRLTLTGDRVYTAASAVTGVYTVTGVHRDGYTLTPEKTDDVNGISAYDAALALMHTVGTATLTGHAFTAGDVNRNGSVSAMDAFYVLQKAVDLITLPFPGAGVVWQFAPASRTYGDLAGDQAAQDFTAILLGDISGNWSAPALARNPVQMSSGPAAGLGTATILDDATVVPVLLNTAGRPVFSLELVISYTVATAAVLEPELTASTAQWLISSNLSEPGVVRVALAGASPLKQPAPVLRLRFVPVAGRALGVAITSARADEQVIDIAPPQSQPPVYLPLVNGR